MPRRGMALVLAMFIVIVSSITTVAVMETLTSEIAALNNAVAYERALYLANAGVHAAAAELEADATWRGTLTEGLFPADDAYTVTAVSGANSTVTVTAQGAAGSVVRTVVAVIEL
ncbi:MAG: hypothetical protein KF847_12370 [Pirellulales bacterium]|nr:hypothetical protein [Pirellulales bacterium]